MSIVVVQKFKDGWDKWRNLSGGGFAKGGKIFGVDGLNNFFDKGSFKK